MGGGQLWLAGVGIYITGTFAQSYGANLQRASLTDEAKRFPNPEDRREKKDQPRWLRGFVCMVLAGFFMSFALFFATQTQLAPLQLFLFVSNFVFAYWLNGEPFDWRTDAPATAVVAVGVFMCLVAAPKDSHNYDQSQMWDKIVSASWISFSVCAPCAVFALFGIQRVLRAECNGDADLLPPWKSTLLSMTYGALPGTMGGINITLTKTTFSLIVGQWKHHDGLAGVFSSPLLYTTAVALVATFLFQMALTVNGLEACSPIIVMSTFAVCEMAVATLGGLLCFHDYTQFELWSALVFAFGILIALTGMCAMARMRYGVEVIVQERRLSQITVITNEVEDYNTLSGLQDSSCFGCISGATRLDEELDVEKEAWDHEESKVDVNLIEPSGKEAISDASQIETHTQVETCLDSEATGMTSPLNARVILYMRRARVVSCICLQHVRSLLCCGLRVML